MYYAGENGVAVFDMVQNMSFLIFYLYEYTAKAMQPLLSTYYGEHNRGGIYYVLKKGLISGSVCGITVALLLAAFPSAVSLLFGLDSPELIAMGNQAVRIFCIGTAAAGCSIILENYYQSCEDGKPAYLLSTLRSAIVLIPGSPGPDSIWNAVPVAVLSAYRVSFPGHFPASGETCGAGNPLIQNESIAGS